MFKRLLKMDLPRGQSAFLWGARQTGKSTYLGQHFPEAVCFNLLKSDTYISLSKAPYLLREQVLALSAAQLSQPIIIAEVQKVPALLDEVHWLIENTGAQFILCGSSARKLRRTGVNLLGGRAWRYHFYPLVSAEIPEFDLLKALNTGLVPSHYLSSNPFKSLQSYIDIYLAEEIKAEGLVRSLPHFARFLDSLAFTNGEMVNYKNIAQDCGVDAKTVQNYYQILVDTLLGYFVLPYNKKIKRDIIRKAPKFYLFDVGVGNYLSKTVVSELRGIAAGNSFEHFILMELMAYKNIYDKTFEIQYWRTKTGYEVDFVLGEAEVAIEVKVSTSVKKSDLKGLMTFCEEHQPKQAIVVSQDLEPRRLSVEGGGFILVLPWRTFLVELWKEAVL